MNRVERIVDIVMEMRKVQREYFKLRSKEALIEAKRLEKEVDELIEEYKERKEI